MREALLFEKSKPGSIGYTLPVSDFPDYISSISIKFIRKKDAQLPEISENEVVRHFVRLSLKNYHIDKGMYPLGSCTMKYNPKINEIAARMSGFSSLHPLQEEQTMQGALELMYELQNFLAEISGFYKVTLQPSAGAQGEFCGVLMFRKYFEKNNSLEQRRKILIPDSAHGTNPATASMAGFQVVTIKSKENGLTDMEHFKSVLGPDIAGMMITNPNTVGIFENQISEICNLMHKTGGLMYMDGANLNALLHICRPGDMGFDVMHYNLHKTFSTPHGGGGPGSGAVGVAEKLKNFLPGPEVIKNGYKYLLNSDNHDSIGRLHTFYGNFGMLVRAYVYIRIHGAKGLKRISENAIINANYIHHKLKNHYHAPYSNQKIMHEAIFSAEWQKKDKGVKTLDIAKRLIDYGIHPFTIYFPMIVHECMMIEPTESEQKENLDSFCDAMIKIAEECKYNPELVKTAPHTTEMGRLDDAFAAKNINVCCVVN